MHNVFDQFVKRLAREGLAPGGHLETEVEVAPDARRIDVWFVPDPGRARHALQPLGLLGRIGRTSCTLEPFHATPSGEQVADCLAKHHFFRRALGRRARRPPVPTQWIISSGRPSTALSGLNFRRSRLGPGVYEGPALLHTKLVVVAELPRTRDTLLVRLMGANETLQQAVTELQALPLTEPEHRLAMPIVVQLRLGAPDETMAKTANDYSEWEIKMIIREVDKYLARLKKEGLDEGLEKGREEGREEGFAKAVLAAYQARFGAPPATLVAAVGKASDLAELQRWLEKVTTLSREEVTAALRASSTRKRAAPKKARRATSAPRRASAASSR